LHHLSAIFMGFGQIPLTLNYRTMDYSKYSVKDCLLTAIKSEIEAKAIYKAIAEQVKNMMLKDRLLFIAEEEVKHREYFESLFKKLFPGEKIVLPEKSPVPLPEIKINKENILLSEIFAKAMEAEMAAFDFYTQLSKKFGDEETKKMLTYIAYMEKGHYNLLELERRAIEEAEDYEINWPMTHVGP